MICAHFSAAFSDRRAKLKQLNSFFQCHFRLGGWRRALSYETRTVLPRWQWNKQWQRQLEFYCNKYSPSWSIFPTIPDPWISLVPLFGGGWLRPALAHTWLCSLGVPSCLAVSTLSSLRWFPWDWRTSQEGAWCLAGSDTDNWIARDRGARKLFSFQLHFAEVRLTFHNMFVSAQGQILQEFCSFHLLH